MLKCVGIKGYRGLSKIRVWLQLKMFSKNYNFFCVKNDSFVKLAEESFLISNDKIKVLHGRPKNDILFRKNDREAVLKKYFDNLPKYKKIILYAPTYRNSKYGNSKIPPTKFFPFKDYRHSKIESYLEKNQYILFIRKHHLDTVNFEESDRIKNLDSNIVSEITDILNIFDLLITDYSGIAYDFLMIDKPIMYIPYDLEEYKKEAGLCFDMSKIFAGPEVSSQKEFLYEMKNLIDNNKYYKEKREKIKEFVWGKNIEQNSSKLVYDYMIKEISNYSQRYQYE